MRGHTVSLLDALRESGAVSPLDHRFAQMLGRRAGITDEAVLAGAALVGSLFDRGHVCVRLREVASVLEREAGARRADGGGDGAFPTLPDPDAWIAALAGATELVRSPAGRHATPLVLDVDALYLDRTWAHQQVLVQAVRARSTAAAPDVDGPALDGILDRLFDGDEAAARAQREAVRTALTRRLTVILGGPRAGRTAVVVGLLAAWQELDETGGRPRTLLLSPTGEAPASGIHRALQIAPHTPGARAFTPSTPSTSTC